MIKNDRRERILVRIIVCLLPDYYDLVVFGIHHFGISSICYGKQMSERELRCSLSHFFSISLSSVSLNFFPFPDEKFPNTFYSM